MPFAWYDLAGTVGVALIIGAYAALQMGKLQSDNRLYSLLNAIGASLVLLSLVFDFNFSAFIVEAFWVVISVYGLIKHRKPMPAS